MVKTTKKKASKLNIKKRDLPKKPTTAKKAVYTFRAHNELMSDFTKLCESRNMSVSAMIEWLIKQAVEAK